MNSPAVPPSFRGRPYVSLAAVLVTLVLIRQFAETSRADASTLNLFLYYALITTGFAWVFGWAGQFAFSHAAFAGIGAYCSIWAARQQVPAVLCPLVAIGMAAVIALVLRLLVRKANEFYFAVATLGFAQITQLVLQQWKGFTGSIGGVTVAIPSFSLGGLTIDTSYRIAMFLTCALGIVLLGGIWLSRSPFYRESIALRDQPVVAAASGVPVLRVQLVSFMLGSATAALGGALYAHTQGFISPDSFGLDLVLGVFLMLIVGGSSSLWGPVIGAAFYVYVPRLLSDVGLSEWTNVLYGSALIVVMVAVPDGLAGVATRLWSTVFGGPASTEVPEAKSMPTPVGREIDPAGAPALEAIDISVSFGGVRAVDGVSLTVNQGEIVGLIGPNGSGKSTFLNALTGIVPARGQLFVAGSRKRLGSPGASRTSGLLRTFQTPQIYQHLSSSENVLLADDDRSMTGLAAAWFARRPMLRREQQRWRRSADALGFVRVDNRLAASLSYGHRRMLELARVIAAQPTVLLLDEPSAGLNATETAQFAKHLRSLRQRGVALLLIDHKMDLISDLCDRVAVLELGRVVAIGSPSHVLADARVIDAYLGIPAEG